MYNSKILKLFRIEPKEATVVFFAFLFALCIGAAEDILYSAPLAMFLSHYKSSSLPLIYIGTGIAALLFGLLFTYLEKRVSVFYVLMIPVAVFAVTFIIFWGLLFVVQASWIFSVILVSALAVASLVGSIVLMLVNQLFTLQQSKRLFGIIYGGVAIGIALPGFMMPALVKWMGTSNLILLIAVFLLGAVAIQYVIRKHSRGRLDAKESEVAKTTKISLKSFKDKKYILNGFLMTALGCFTYFVLDLLLNTTVQQHFPNEERMTAFYGILVAVYGVTSLLATFYLSGWILSRFGLMIALLVLPVGVAVLLTGAFLANLIPSFAAAVFWCIVATAVFDGMTRETILDEALVLLFQPFRTAQRAWAQIYNETIVAPIAIAGAGGVLFVITKYFSVKLSISLLIMLGLSITMIALVVFVIKNRYLKLLVESVSKRSIIQPRFTKLDKKSFGLLKNLLKSKYPEEVIYVLKTIEGLDRNDFTKVLLESIDSPLKEVRNWVLCKIEKYHIKAAEDSVKKLCLKEQDPAVLGRGLLALGAITDLDQVSWFTNYLIHSNRKIAGSSTIALLKYGSEIAQKRAVENLIAKTKSSKEEERLIVAEILKHVDLPIKTELLISLLKDTNLEVRKNACEAVSNQADARLYPLIIENLSIPSVHKEAFYSLQSLGKPLFDYITTQFESYSPDVQLHLIRFLGFVKEPQATEFLLKLLSSTNRRSLYSILISLRRHSYVVTDESMRQIVDDRLISEHKNILYLQEIVVHFNSEQTRLLRDLINREIALSQECCFLLLSLLYPGSQISKAEAGLLLKDEDLNSNAVEILIYALHEAEHKVLIPQLADRSYSENTSYSEIDPKIEEFLLKIVDYTRQCFLPALASAVIYTIGILRLKDLFDIVRDKEFTADYLMQEMMSWTQDRLKAS